MVILAVHLAFPVDGMRSFPATQAKLSEVPGGVAVEVNGRRFVALAGTYILETGLEPPLAPAPATVPQGKRR